MNRRFIFVFLFSALTLILINYTSYHNVEFRFIQRIQGFNNKAKIKIPYELYYNIDAFQYDVEEILPRMDSVQFPIQNLLNAVHSMNFNDSTYIICYEEIITEIKYKKIDLFDAKALNRFLKNNEPRFNIVTKPSPHGFIYIYAIPKKYNLILRDNG